MKSTHLSLQLVAVVLAFFLAGINSQQQCFDERVAADSTLSQCAMSLTTEGKRNDNIDGTQVVELVCSDRCRQRTINAFLECGGQAEAESLRFGCVNDTNGRFCLQVFAELFAGTGNTTSFQELLSADCAALDKVGCCLGNYVEYLQTTFELTGASQSARVEMIPILGECEVVTPCESNSQTSAASIINPCFNQRVAVDPLLAECAESLTDSDPEVIDTETTCSEVCLTRLQNATRACGVPVTFGCDDELLELKLSLREIIILVVTGAICAILFFCIGVTLAVLCGIARSRKKDPPTATSFELRTDTLGHPNTETVTIENEAFYESVEEPRKGGAELDESHKKTLI